MLSKIFNNKPFFYFLSFFIPVIIILSVCFSLGIYPFGDKSYLIWDSNIQFVPFLGYFKSIFTSNTDFIYSLSKAGGNGMFDFNACYINNPLNFIAFLFPDNRLDIAFQTIVTIKIALCGLAFSYFLNHDKDFDWKTLIFSTAYALSTCAIFFSQSIMGFEGMYLLPVALVGISKIIKEQKSLLYILSVALTFLLEPYAGWVVLLFSSFWFWYLFVIHFPELENRKKVILLYFISLLFIGGLSAAITLPTYLSLQGTKYNVRFMPDLFIFDPRDIFACFYTGKTNFNEFWAARYPYIYAGILPFILFIAYFLNKGIELKHRLMTSIFVIFIMFSFCWHIPFSLFNGGIVFPTGCIYRFVYIFIMLMLAISFVSFKSLELMTKKSFINVFLIFSLITGYVYFFPCEGINGKIIIFDYIFGLICISLLYMLSVKKKPLIYGILMILCFGELFYNAFVCYGQQDKCILSDPSEFKQNYDGFSRTVNNIKNNDKGFYRIDTDETLFSNELWVTIHRHNTGLLYNYPSISHYSSLGNVQLRSFYAHMGFDTNFLNNIISYNDNLPVFPSAFMGIKYILSSKDEHINPYNQIMTTEKTTKPVYVYENPYALPLGFISENEILSLSVKDQESVFETYNILPKTITKQDFGNIFNIFETDEVEYNDDQTIAKIKITAQDNQKLWVSKSYIGLFQFMMIVANHTQLRPLNFTVIPIIEYIGDYQKGEEIDILAFRNFSVQRFETKVFAASENVDVLKKYFDFIKQKPCDLEVISSSHIKGTFETDKNYQVLVLTIPYDDNWKIKIDNKPVKQLQILNGLNGILVAKAGEHTIEMKYKQKGLAGGVLISLLVLILLVYFSRKKLV